MSIKKWFLPLILSIAFILRVVALDKYPVGFTPDEASFGYDAYSLIHTGKDQWGNAWPLVLKSFGDYKAPLYAYLSMPFIALFDLTKFAVRLPNALLSVISIYVVYLLAKKLFDEKVGLLSALLFAISPWHMMMSRGAFEANLITFFLPLGIYLFLQKRYSLAAFVFGLNLFTYHSAKLITPLVIVGLILISINELKELGIKKLFKPLFILFVFGTLTLYTFTQGAGARVKDINIFSGSTEEGSVIKNLAVSAGEPYLLSKIYHNKFTVSFDRFVNNYVSYFSPQFLVTKGPAETTYGMMPGNGVLTIVEFVGFLSFIFYFIKFKNYRLQLFMLFWLFVSAIPASLATGPGYAGNRAVAMLPAIQIISSIGIIHLIEGRKYIKYALLAIGLVGFIVFCENYIYLSPSKSAQGMLYGNLEVAQYINTNSSSYDNIVVSKSLSEPHIYVAFATKFDPTEYQIATRRWNFEEKNLKWVDQLDEYRFGKFIFKRYNWRDGIDPNNLVIGRPDEFLPDTETLLKINYPNSEPSIYVKSN